MASLNPTQPRIGRAAVSAAATTAYAALFCIAFFYLKHDPRTRTAIPFASDPYDSVGSFALLGSIPLCLLALKRAFRPSGELAAPDARLLLERTELAVLLGAVATSVADLVAMAKRFDLWFHSSGAFAIAALVAGQLALAVALTAAVRPGKRKLAWRKFGAAAVSLPLFAAALWLFPDGMTGSLPGEISALAFGVVWLFWQVSLWLAALTPPDEPHRDAGPSRAGLALTAALGVGAIVGSALFSLEAAEPGGVSATRFLLVAAVFVAAGSLGSGIGYVFLRKPLRLP